MNSEPSPSHLGSPEGQRDSTSGLNSLVFLAALVAPPVLTLICACVQPPDQSAGRVALIGSALGGITGGVVLGRHFGGAAASCFMLAILFSLILIPISLFLCFIGCTTGGSGRGF